MKQPFTLHDFTRDNTDRGNKVQNQKQGHFSLFRSLLWSEWSRDPVKLSVWIRLLSDASFKPRTVKFHGKEYHLEPGELVTTSTLIGSKILLNGERIEKRSTLRILKFFEREKMIHLRTDHSALIIFIINYCSYQEIERGTPQGIPSGTHDGIPNGTPNTSRGAGLKVVGGTPHGTPLGTLASTPSGTQNNNDLNNDLIKDPSPPPKKGGSPGGPLASIRSDAAVQSASGNFWGTAEDLRLAQWIYGLVSQIQKRSKPPRWSQWANDVRLIRTTQECDHRTIAKTFKWANSDGFWQTNVLSPSNLRRHWDKLFIQSQHVATKRSYSNDHHSIDFDNADWAEGLDL